jgi:hypothetical protein
MKERRARLEQIHQMGLARNEKLERGAFSSEKEACDALMSIRFRYEKEYMTYCLIRAKMVHGCIGTRFEFDGMAKHREMIKGRLNPSHIDQNGQGGPWW